MTNFTKPVICPSLVQLVRVPVFVDDISKLEVDVIVYSAVPAKNCETKEERCPVNSYFNKLYFIASNLPIDEYDSHHKGGLSILQLRCTHCIPSKNNFKN